MLSGMLLKALKLSLAFVARIVTINDSADDIIIFIENMKNVFSF